MSKVIYTKENHILLNIDNFVLHFSIAHEKPPKTQSGTINWDVISRLQLINIGKKMLINGFQPNWIQLWQSN